MSLQSSDKGHRILLFNVYTLGLTLGWFLKGISTLECNTCSSDLAAFYLAAYFHHLELFSIHVHRRPDYHPLRSLRNNNSLSRVITVDHASSREHTVQPGWYRLLSYRNTFPSLLNPLVDLYFHSPPVKFPGLFNWTVWAQGLMDNKAQHGTFTHNLTCFFSANLTFPIYCILSDNLNQSFRVFYRLMEGFSDWLLPPNKYSSRIYCHCDSPRYSTNASNECSWQEKRLVVWILSTFSSSLEC